MRCHLRMLALLFTSVFVLTPISRSQTASSSLRGTVTDPKGALVQGAMITLANPSTGFTRSTKSGDGVYQFLEVPPATYTVTVTVEGFATLKRERVALQVNQPATLDIEMQVQGSTEIVEVTGAAPLVNTTDASMGHAFNTEQILSVPAKFCFDQSGPFLRPFAPSFRARKFAGFLTSQISAVKFVFSFPGLASIETFYITNST